MQKQGRVDGHVATSEETAIKQVRNRIGTGLAASKRNPCDDMFRHIRIVYMDAVDNAGAAEELFYVLNGGATRQVQYLNEHLFMRP